MRNMAMRISKNNLPRSWTPVKVRVNSKGQVQLAINPAALERCVKAVKKRKGVKSAYAVCTAAMKKNRNRRKSR